jgi:hypothetical protein
MMLLKRFFLPVLFLILPVILALGCATLQPGDIPAESRWETPKPLNLEISADVYQIRLDLLRERIDARTSTVIVASGSYKQQSEEFVSQHYLGAYIGNGFFLDVNGNIAIDVIRLLGFDEAYAFKLHRTESGVLDVPREAEREGKTITLTAGSLIASSVTTRIEEDGYSIKTSDFFSPDKIVFSDNKIEYIPSGLFSMFRTDSIQQEGSLARSSTNFRIEQIDENRLNVNGSCEIIREANKIVLMSRGFPLITMVKSGDRYVFFRSNSYGSWIEKLPDKIRISDNGSITEYSYTVEAQPVKQQPPRRERAEESGQPAKRAKSGRLKTEKRVERNTSRDASSPLPPN